MRAEGGAITGLFLKGQRHAPALSWEELPRETSDLLLLAANAWLIRYFAGENPPVDLPLEPPGTAFQKAVWALLTEIPYGKTVTYGDLARRLSSSPRAVGGAVGRNPISILIPCHRVVGAGGSLTGYAGGLAAKKFLLALSAQNIDDLSVSRMRMRADRTSLEQDHFAEHAEIDRLSAQR